MPRGVEKHFHVSALVIVAVVTDHLAAAVPKFRPVNAEHRKYDVVLHVIRTERLIVIVDDGDGVLWR